MQFATNLLGTTAASAHPGVGSIGQYYVKETTDPLATFRHWKTIDSKTVQKESRRPMEWLTSGMVRSFSHLAAPGGRRARLVILCYHRVLNAPDPLAPGAIHRDAFDAQMKTLAKHFNPLSLRDAVQHLFAGTLPARSVCVTFDDGYADNLDVALPILQSNDIPATVFVATSFLDGGIMWNDMIVESVRRVRSDELDCRSIGLEFLPIATPEQKGEAALKIVLHLRRLPSEQRQRFVSEFTQRIGADLPDDLMLSSDQVLELHRAGVEIGSHTVTHPILTRLDPKRADAEIRDSRTFLETLTGAPIVGFAYPNGVPGVDYDSGHVRAVADSGFDYAVTTAPGSATGRADRFQLPRIGSWDQPAKRFAARVAGTYVAKREQVV